MIFSVIQLYFQIQILSNMMILAKAYLQRQTYSRIYARIRRLEYVERLPFTLFNFDKNIPDLNEKNYEANILEIKEYKPNTCIDVCVMEPLELKGNEKRIASCKKVGGDKKRVGHAREIDFKIQYNPSSVNQKIEYGATSDTQIDPTHPIVEKLKTELGISGTSLNVSNKSGKNIQFTLGKIPELEGDTNIDWICDKQNSRLLFNKYLKKTDSLAPADLMVYKDIDRNKWMFFNMDHVVEFIVENAIWRKLDTGRLKGDFTDNSKKGLSQYLTYEYRSTHKSYFLGLNGGKGQEFIELLKNKIAMVEEPILSNEPKESIYQS